VSTLEKAFRMVDIGPNAESKEEVYSNAHTHFFIFDFKFGLLLPMIFTDDLKQALEFRKFWGEKADLRRFKDGRIAESTGKAYIVTIHFFLSSLSISVLSYLLAEIKYLDDY